MRAHREEAHDAGGRGRVVAYAPTPSPGFRAERLLFPDRPGPPVTSVLIERIQDELDREDATPWDHAADKPRE